MAARLSSVSILLTILMLFAAVGVVFSDGVLERSHRDLTTSAAAEQEVLYLPSGEGLKLLSLGYEAVLSHYLWFTTLNYFGKHFESDGNYEWLYHRCDLITRLNPKARHVYKFCSLMLAWEQQVPELSVRLLSRALEFFPNDWEFFYHRGFLSFFFLKDEEAARADLLKASQMPDVPAGVVSLATKKVTQGTSGAMAKQILGQMLETTDDSRVREVIIKRLRGLEK